MSKKKIAVISSPFTSIEFPSLHSSIAYSNFLRNKYDVELIRLNRQFAELIGHSNYNRIASIQRAVGVGDWIGSEILRYKSEFSTETVEARKFKTFSDYLLDTGFYCEKDILFFNKVSEITKDYILQKATHYSWNSYDHVFLCCSHQQIGFNLSFAKILSENFNVKITFFGSIFKDVKVADVCLKNFDYLHSILIGDIETIFQDIPNILKSKGSVNFPKTITQNKSANEVTYDFSLNGKFDFADFFEKENGDPIQSVLPWKTSVGCEWSIKNHCTFCGLVPESGGYSNLNGNIALDSFKELLDENRGLDVVTTDLLLPHEYLSSFLPNLIKENLDHTLFYEIRATLKKNDIKILAKAGVQHVQVGIESFNFETLKAMKKGTTTLINIRCLKWLYEQGICTSWIYLHGFKEDDEMSYRFQSELISSINHLQPPIDVTSVRIERGSPMHKDPCKFGFKNVLPAEACLHTYPLSLEDQFDFTMYFDHEYEDDRDVSKLSKELVGTVMDWKNNWEMDTLYYKKGPSFIKIINYSQEEIITLSDWQKTIFEYLDDIRSYSAILKYSKKINSEITEDDLNSFLSELKNSKILVSSRERWVSVVPRFQTHQSGRNRMLRRSKLYK